MRRPVHPRLLRATACLAVACIALLLLASCATVDRHPVATVSTVLLAATVADVESTFAAIDTGRAKEANPFMAPLIARGRIPSYAFVLSLDAWLLWDAARAHKTGDPTWWVLPVVLSTAHGVAGGCNMRFVW